MLRVERVGKRLKSFAGLRPRSLEEFYELGDFIANSPTEFFEELGESFLLAGAGLHLGGKSGSYVDALAVDERGDVVVVLIVHAEEARPLERAMTAASQVASMGPDGLLATVGAPKARGIRAFLGERYAELNRKQRVLLLAESFDEALMSTASWLSHGYGVDLNCVRVTLAQDPSTGEEFLRCERMGPEKASLPQAQRRAEPLAPNSPEPREAAESEPLTGVKESSFPSAADAAPIGPLPDNLFDPAVEELAGAAAPSPQAEPARGEQERRADERKSDAASSAVEVQYAGRAMAAALVDYSSGGVGVTLHSPLPVGAEVRVRGRLRSADAEIELARSGRIVHCTFEDRMFRLGVAFTPNGAGE